MKEETFNLPAQQVKGVVFNGTFQDVQRIIDFFEAHKETVVIKAQIQMDNANSKDWSIGVLLAQDSKIIDLTGEPMRTVYHQLYAGDVVMEINKVLVTVTSQMYNLLGFKSDSDKNNINIEHKTVSSNDEWTDLVGDNESFPEIH